MKIEKLSMSALNRTTVENYISQEKIGLYIIADNIRSGQNIGSLFRTSDAFAIDKVYLTGISPIPPNKEILKTALGATESVGWEYFEDNLKLIQFLKEKGVKILVIEQTNVSQSLHTYSFDFSFKYAIVLGNEVDGVSDIFLTHADAIIEIPQIGTKHSLNVSVCAGIVLWNFFSQKMLLDKNTFSGANI